MFKRSLGHRASVHHLAWQLKPKARAHTLFRTHAQSTLLQHHQALTYRQTQTRPAVSAIGLLIGMLKTVENLQLTAQGYTAPRVLHLEPEPIALHQASHIDATSCCELDGVVQQLVDNLRHSSSVNLNPHIRDVPPQTQALALRSPHIRLCKAVHPRQKIAGFGVKHHASRFELREIQNVVDEGQQTLGRAADQIHRFDGLGLMFELIAEHPIETQNRIHRRAQFVADGSHELVLVGLRLQQFSVDVEQRLVASLHLQQATAVQQVKQPQSHHQTGHGTQMVEKCPWQGFIVVGDGAAQPPLLSAHPQQGLSSQGHAQPQAGTCWAQQQEGSDRHHHQPHQHAGVDTPGLEGDGGHAQDDGRQKNVANQVVEAGKHRQGHEQKKKGAEPHIHSVVICGLRDEIKHQRAQGRDGDANHQQLAAIEQTARQQVPPFHPPSLCHMQVNPLNLMVNCLVRWSLNS